MGDSFAWLFYRDEHQLLDEHALQEFVVPIPAGIGGQGELAFVSALPGFGGRFVLHHGITTILRLGDVSLIDVARSRVVAIGELKTNRTNPEELNVQVSFISAKGEMIDETQLPRKQELRQQAVPHLNQRALSRLHRQLKRTEKAIRPTQDRFEPQSVAVEGDTYAPELAKAVANARRGTWTTHQAGPGLLFLSYRTRCKSLEGRLREISTTAALRIATGKNPSSAVVALILRGSAHNAIVTGSVLYDPKGRPHLTRQAIPMVWLGLDRDLVFRLLTLDTSVISIYNPAHLYAAFERRGWKVEKGGAPSSVVLQRQEGDKRQRLHGMDWFMRDVTLGLRTEDQVASAVELGTQEIRRREVPQPTRVILDLRHVLPPLETTDLFDSSADATGGQDGN